MQKTLNLQNYGINEGKRASLLILPAETVLDAVRRQVPVRYSIRDGRVIATTQPTITQIQLDDVEPSVTAISHIAETKFYPPTRGLLSLQSMRTPCCFFLLVFHIAS
ncbi:Cytosine deaminase [Providencia alcalifaciens]|nr:Cytosine deaminase [Providencia alcalifaciens]